MEMMKKINDCQGFRKKKLRKCNLLEIRKKFSNEGLERWVSIKSTCYATDPGFGSQHLYEKLNIVSCMPVTYAHNPSTVWGRDKRVLELGGHWSSRLRERETLPHRNKSESDRGHSVSSSGLYMCRQARVPTYTNPQRTHTQKFQGDI